MIKSPDKCNQYCGQKMSSEKYSVYSITQKVFFQVIENVSKFYILLLTNLFKDTILISITVIVIIFKISFQKGRIT